jgi:pimeloyl-ACP methyl ester carboxylesterase
MWYTLFILICLLSYAGFSQEATPLKQIPDTLSITLENVQYPYPIKFMETEIGCEDLRMAYMDVTPLKPNGKVVMLFHGKNFAGYYWTNVISPLVEQGYRVIVPDQIGFGKSSKPLIQYSFHLLATQNRKLLDTLDVEKVLLIGHSMGGMLATRFALMYPQRVEKLILENPIGLEDYRSIIPYVTLEEQYAIELKTTAASVKRYYQTSYFPKWKNEYDYLVQIASGVVNSSDFPRYAKVSASTYLMIYEQPVAHEFDRLMVPTALMIGTLDRTVVGKDKLPKDQRDKFGNYAVLGKQIASKIKNAVLVEFTAGHIPHIEITDEFNKALLNQLK